MYKSINEEAEAKHSCWNAKKKKKAAQNKKQTNKNFNYL